MRNFFTTKISTLMWATAITVALGMIAANHLVLRQVRTEAIRQAELQQERSLATFWELVSETGRDYRIEGGQLWAGGYLLSGNNEIPDKVLGITGSRATIFMRDIRVATNVPLADGSRALGTPLRGPAFDAVFRKGISYRGEAIILGERYFAAYDPLRNEAGEVIGALFVGVKKVEYLAGFERMSLRIRAINGTLAAVFVLAASLLLLERKRSEDAMRKQLSFQQVLIDTIPSPIFHKDAGGRYTGCNHAFLSFVGLGIDELCGKTVHEVWPASLAAIYQASDRELMERAGAHSFEAHVMHADGTPHDVIFHKATFWDDKGAPAGVVGVMLDITERKAAEEEVKSAYQRTADILEFLPDGTFVVDREKRVIAWNRAMEEMTGVSKEEIIGTGDFSYALPFYGSRREILIDLLELGEEEIGQRYREAKRVGRTIFGEMRIEKYRGGQDRIFRGAASPLFDREGNRTGGIETIRDITDLRRSAQEKHRLAVQLHHSRMMESLMVQLSHDLKTPLTPLFALIPMLRSRIDDPQLQRMLEICQQSAGQIQALAEKSLLLVRLSSPAGRLEPVPVSLALVAEQAAEGAAAELAEGGMHCENGIARGLLVLGVAEQLELLFRNLLSNCARYGARRGTVRLGSEERGGTVTISVSDDGIGLDPQHTALIFSEFFKVDAARHDLDTQGLGLAICQRIVANHGGRIWAESPGRGQGTTIFFTLQVAGAAKVADDRTRQGKST